MSPRSGHYAAWASAPERVPTDAAARLQPNEPQPLGMTCTRALWTAGSSTYMTTPHSLDRLSRTRAVTTGTSSARPLTPAPAVERPAPADRNAAPHRQFSLPIQRHFSVPLDTRAPRAVFKESTAAPRICSGPFTPKTGDGGRLRSLNTLRHSAKPRRCDTLEQGHLAIQWLCRVVGPSPARPARFAGRRTVPPGYQPAAGSDPRLRRDARHSRAR